MVILNLVVVVDLEEIFSLEEKWIKDLVLEEEWIKVKVWINLEVLVDRVLGKIKDKKVEVDLGMNLEVVVVIFMIQ